MDGIGVRGVFAAGAANAHLGEAEPDARVSIGKHTQDCVWLDPKKVRVWKGNPRAFEELTPESVADLIQTIGSLRQAIPVIVREVLDDPDYAYEVIAGSRRHFAVRWLQQNGHPTIRLLAQLTNYDDRRAFHAADLENRGRKDISDLERARSYRVAWKEIYGGPQAHMAVLLRYTEGHFSKLLQLCDLSEEFIAAYGGSSAVTVANAYDLLPALKNSAHRESALKLAGELACEQARRAAAKEEALPGLEIKDKLLAVLRTPSGEPAGQPSNRHIELVSESGAIRLVVSSGKKKTSVSFPSSAKAPRDEWERLLPELLDVLAEKGNVLA